MKLNLFAVFAIALCFISGISRGQNVRVGGFVGVTNSNFSNPVYYRHENITFQSKSRLSYQLGLDCSIDLNEKGSIGILLRPTYNQLGVRFEDAPADGIGDVGSTVNFTHNLQYLSISSLLKVSLLKNDALYSALGMYNGYLLNSQMKGEASSPDYGEISIDRNLPWLTADRGVEFLLGSSLYSDGTKQFFIEVGYNYGLRASYQLTNRYFNARTGVRFTI